MRVDVDKRAAVISTRRAWIDVVRGLAIVLVVLGHAIQFGAQEHFDFFSEPVFATIYAFHMPLFALVSGYLAGPSDQRHTPAGMIVGRARSVLVPFLAWSVAGGLLTAGLLMLARGIADPWLPVRQIVQSVLFPELGLWFLWVVFVFSVLTAVSRVAPGPLRWVALGALLALVYLLPPTDILAVVQLQWLLPFFTAGFIAVRIKRFLARHELAVTLLGAAAFVALRPFWSRDDSVYLHRMGPEPDVISTLTQFGFRYAIAFAGSIAVIGLVRAVYRRRRMRVLESLGIASLGIYAAQTYLMLIVGYAPSPAQPWLYALGYVPLVTIAVLALSFTITRALARFRWTRVLFLGSR